MADNDFAHVEAPSLPSKASGVSSFLLVAGILAVVALAFSGGYWLGKEHGAQIADSAEKARLVAQIHQQEEEMAKLRKEAQQRRRDGDVSTSKIGDLTFYNDLPKQSVTPAPLSGTGVAKPVEMPSPAEEPPAPGKDTPPQAANGDELLRNIIEREMTGGKLTPEYVVQVGSFRSRKETEPLLKRLDGVGLHSTVRKVDLKTKGQWFRVYVGPYASRKEADKAHVRIQKALKIDGLVLRDR